MVGGFSRFVESIWQTNPEIMKQVANLIAKLITGRNVLGSAVSQKLTERDLIRLESKIGAALFGPLPKGHRREFFCLDAHTWIWYEEWTDAAGKTQSHTIRYEVRHNGVIKVQDGQAYQVVEGQELENLVMATDLYRERVSRGLYHRDHLTGEPLPITPKK